MSQVFLEILDGTNHLVNRSLATLPRSDPSQSNFQLKTVETVKDSF